MMRTDDVLNIITDAINDLPTVSDKPNDDGTYSIFETEIEKVSDGLQVSFTEEHGGHKETDVYLISVTLIK